MCSLLPSGVVNDSVGPCANENSPMILTLRNWMLPWDDPGSDASATPKALNSAKRRMSLPCDKVGGAQITFNDPSGGQVRQELRFGRIGCSSDRFTAVTRCRRYELDAGSSLAWVRSVGLSERCSNSSIDAAGERCRQLLLQRSAPDKSI